MAGRGRRRWRWCRRATTRAAPTGTGSIRCPASGRAAGSGTRCSGRKHGRQSIRLTRNGFALHGQRLYVAKVGEMQVSWSRPLPSAPSSVTVIRERGRPVLRLVRGGTPAGAAARLRPRGRHRRRAWPAWRSPRTARSSLTRGSCAQSERRLARAQRALSRKQKGSANRAKARHRVAVLHRKVRETRLDHAHKTALRLVRDNQAVYAEDLAVSGLARTRLAKSVHDAGWAQLLRLVDEKAQQYGRGFYRIGRFEPTSQVCSACGVKDGPKPLSRPRRGRARHAGRCTTGTSTPRGTSWRPGGPTG